MRRKVLKDKSHGPDKKNKVNRDKGWAKGGCIQVKNADMVSEIPPLVYLQKPHKWILCNFAQTSISIWKSDCIPSWSVPLLFLPEEHLPYSPGSSANHYILSLFSQTSLWLHRSISSISATSLPWFSFPGKVSQSWESILSLFLKNIPKFCLLFLQSFDLYRWNLLQIFR